jgi:hypothetical protein
VEVLGRTFGGRRKEDWFCLEEMVRDLDFPPLDEFGEEREGAKERDRETEREAE